VLDGLHVVIHVKVNVAMVNIVWNVIIVGVVVIVLNMNVAVFISHYIIKNIKLLTTSKETEYVGLSGFGLNVVDKIVVL